MVLVTAIANPKRLDTYLPEGVVKKITLDDHAYFDKAVLEDYFKTYEAESLLVTEKDAVKMQDFKLPLSIMKLKLVIEDELFLSIDKYVNTFNK
jgi:tetraacyldisaccharide 4'-kinase